MTTIRLRHSPLMAYAGDGTPPSYEPYWIILGAHSGTPGSVFVWDGDDWSSDLAEAILHDNPGDAMEQERHLAALPWMSARAVIRAVSLADYLRLPGQPLTWDASEDALRAIYRHAGIGAGL